MTTIILDRYVFETLMPDLVGHDRRPSAFLVYLAIATAAKTGSVQLSHADLAERTGLSKRAVQASVDWLSNRKLISASRTGITSINRYVPHQPWRPLARRS